MRILRLSGACVGALGLVAFGSLLGAVAMAQSTTTVTLAPNGVAQVGCQGSALETGQPSSNPGADLACIPSSAKPFQIYKASGTTSALATVNTEGFEVFGVILISAAQLPGTPPQTVQVSPGNLATFVQRENGAPGDVELWDFEAGLTNQTIIATASQPGAEIQMTIFAFLAGRDGPGIGNPVEANSTTGPPTVTVTPQFSSSIVLGVGIDNARAVDRKLPNTQVIDQETLGASSTLWAQHVKAPTQVSVPLTVNDLKPTRDPWNFLAVEISPASA